MLVSVGVWLEGFMSQVLGFVGFRWASSPVLVREYHGRTQFFKRHTQQGVNPMKPLRRMCGEPGVAPYILVCHGRYAFRNAQLLLKEYACCDDNAY